jgi:multicomponent Na+:H+ antiporter subunit F
MTGRSPVDRLVALQLGAVMDTLILVMLAQGFNRPPFYDLALVLALLSLAGGLVFIRFLERWI